MSFVQAGFRFPVPFIAKLDQWMNELNAPPMCMDLSRSDMIREVLEWALPLRPPIEDQFASQTEWRDLLQVAVRLPREMVHRIDEYLLQANKTRDLHKFNRTDFVRCVMTWALVERPEWENGKIVAARDRAVEHSIFQCARTTVASSYKRLYFDVVLKMPVGNFPAGERFDFATIDFSSSMLRIYRQRNDAEPRCVARLRLAVSSVLKENSQ